MTILKMTETIRNANYQRDRDGVPVNTLPIKEDLEKLADEISQKFEKTPVTKELLEELFGCREISHINTIYKKMERKPFEAVGKYVEKATVTKGYGFAEFSINFYVRDDIENSIKKARKKQA